MAGNLSNTTNSCRVQDVNYSNIVQVSARWGSARLLRAVWAVTVQLQRLLWHSIARWGPATAAAATVYWQLSILSVWLLDIYWCIFHNIVCGLGLMSLYILENSLYSLFISVYMQDKST